MSRKPSVEIAETSDAGFYDEDSKLNLWQALRTYPKAAGYCFALTTAILLWGYDMAMTGNLTSLPEFKKDYGIFDKDEDDYIIASNWMGAWNAGSPIGIMAGSLVAGVLQDRYGRRPTLALGSLTSAIGVAVVFISTYVGPAERHGILMLGKILQGFTVGIAACTAQTYMSEVLTPTLRGPLIAFIPLLFFVGQLISALVTFNAEDMPGKMSYRICIISEWPFSAVPLVVSIIMPESPAHFIRKGKLDAALKSQKRLDTAQMDSVGRVAEIQRSIEHEQEQARAENRLQYVECFRSSDRRRTFIVMFAAAIPQLFGMPILGDGAYFLQIAGLESDTSLLFLIAGIVAGLIGNAVNMFLSTIAGRRRLALATLIPLTLLWLGMGIAGCFDSPITPWYTAVTSTFVCITASLGVWPISYVIGGEVSSLRLRAKSQGIGWAFGGICNFVFSLAVPYIYNPDAGDLGPRIGFIWCVICFLTTLGVWFFVPEMKGRSPLQLDIMFEQKVPTRKFREWEPLQDSANSSTAPVKV